MYLPHGLAAKQKAIPKSVLLTCTTATVFACRTSLYNRHGESTCSSPNVTTVRLRLRLRLRLFLPHESTLMWRSCRDMRPNPDRHGCSWQKFREQPIPLAISLTLCIEGSCTAGGNKQTTWADLPVFSSPHPSPSTIKHRLPTHSLYLRCYIVDQ